MQFVRTEKLKIGMRLARPIYSKKGVLLFERNSRLTQQAIESVHNFGLLGIYVLEPAEPLPPMSEEDLEFERFQTMMAVSLQEETERILNEGKKGRINHISGMLVKKFGHLDGKMNFYQNLRSKEDYVYRHSLNVAILCTLMSHMMNMRIEEQNHTVCAALLHDMGRVRFQSDMFDRNELSAVSQLGLLEAQSQAVDLIEDAVTDGTAIRRICMQMLKLQMDMLNGEKEASNAKMLAGAKVLTVANRYDELTAMSLTGTAESEVKALREFRDNPHIYDPAIVEALICSINILLPGSCVELNTGEKALVLAENIKDVLRPMVLSFRDNSIIDLSLRANRDIEIVDIMKTLDNRYIMDTDALHQAGY